jgi:hypothetical protein
VPWCEECAKYWAPAGLRDDGTCPACGRPVDAPAVQPTRVTAKDLDLKALAGDEDVSAPWHFKLLIVLLAAYLGWRVVDLVI